MQNWFPLPRMQFSPWRLTHLMSRGQLLWVVSLALPMVFAAYFYQFESAVQRRWLMGVDLTR